MVTELGGISGRRRSARAMGGVRVITGMLIFYAFLVALILAITQQAVTARLSNGQSAPGYASAYAMMKQVEDRRRQLPALVAAEAKLLEDLAARQRALREREAAYHDAWGEFQPLLRRAATPGTCGIELGDRPLDSYDVRLGLWSEVRQCAADPGSRWSGAAQFQALSSGQSSFPVAYRRALAANSDVEEATRRLEGIQARVSLARDLAPEQRMVMESFDEMTALRGSWMLGGERLVSLPPAVVQLLLSAASGAFGALLIVLVLIVYPQNALMITSDHAYGSRVMLGALIAVCVYVILLGGTAILGSADGFDAAGSNYMTFAAVSILAGMFSDRVAYWLSDRADAFFGRGKAVDGHSEARRPGEAGATSSA